MNEVVRRVSQHLWRFCGRQWAGKLCLCWIRALGIIYSGVSLKSCRECLLWSLYEIKSMWCCFILLSSYEVGVGIKKTSIACHFLSMADIKRWQMLRREKVQPFTQYLHTKRKTSNEESPQINFYSSIPSDTTKHPRSQPVRGKKNLRFNFLLLSRVCKKFCCIPFVTTNNSVMK